MLPIIRHLERVFELKKRVSCGLISRQAVCSCECLHRAFVMSRTRRLSHILLGLLYEDSLACRILRYNWGLRAALSECVLELRLIRERVSLLGCLLEPVHEGHLLHGCCR